MAKYRKISTHIWNDDKVRDMSDNAKLALLFILTHPHMTPLGAIRANIPGLAHELGWSSRRLTKTLSEVFDKGIARYDDRAPLMWFPNFLKHNPPESPNVVTSWAGSFEDLPECELRNDIFSAACAHANARGASFREAFEKAFGISSERLPGTLSEGFGEPFPKGMPNQEQEQEQEQKIKTPPTPSQGEDGCSAVSGDSFSREKPKREKRTLGNSAPELRAAIDAYTNNAELRDALEAYRVMRDRIRKPLTGDGLRYTLRELDKLANGDETRKIAIVEQSVQRSWQGLFDVRSNAQAGATAEEDQTNGHGPIFFPDGTSNPWGTFWQGMLEDGYSTPEEVAKKGYNLDEARKIWESGKRNKAGVRHATADGRANPGLVGALQGRPGGATSGLGTAAAS